MRIVLENAGARKGSLLLSRDGALSLAADARVENQNLVLRARGELGLAEGLFPTPTLNYVSRSRDRVLLDDAASLNPYSADEYFSRQRPKSVLCFPIVKQTRLIGVLYLENELATHAFTDRLAVLELLAAQAAISLENALVYEALQESESKYRRIVDTANEGIWLLGPDALTASVNARMAEMLGSSAKEMIGRPVTDFIFAEDVPDHLKRMENRRQGRSESYERRFRRKSGETLWTLGCATPILDEQHHFKGAFAMFTDITERKQAEKEVVKLNQELGRRVVELQAANRDLETMTYSVSHDLRQPLRTIDGFLGLLKKRVGATFDDEGRRYMTTISRML